MLKLSPQSTVRGSVLTVEGTLGGAWVREVKEACDALLNKDGRVVLDLRGVVFVDRAGAELLDTLRADPRVEIESTSSFVAELLKGGAA